MTLIAGIVLGASIAYAQQLLGRALAGTWWALPWGVAALVVLTFGVGFAWAAIQGLIHLGVAQ
jgi:hypothetical protein